ncbi:MAG: hypothetical protein WCH98_23120 [Verrucomicrobiota bacterium]
MRTFLPLLVASSTILLFPALGSSQENSEAVRTARILDSQEVDLGNRFIIYNRIETPKLKPEPAKLAPVEVAEVPMTAQEEAELRKWESKFQDSLFLGVTVYDGQFSEVRWREGEQENMVWSNVNFFHFTSLTDLETETAYYSLMFSGSETTSEQVRVLNAEAQSLSEIIGLPPSELPPLSKTGPKWMSAGKLSEAAVRAMEDLHDYYQIHGAVMAEDYNRRVAEAKAQEEWEKAHPPVPQDTTINFFPIRSSSRGIVTADQLEKAGK